MGKIVNPEKQYYIISAKHTHRNDDFITLWRANNAGYCYDFVSAGVYIGFEEGYHNDGSNIPVEKHIAGPLFIPGGLPNTNSVWKHFGYKLVKGKLETLNPGPAEGQQ